MLMNLKYGNVWLSYDILKGPIWADPHQRAGGRGDVGGGDGLD